MTIEEAMENTGKECTVYTRSYNLASLNGKLFIIAGGRHEWHGKEVHDFIEVRRAGEEHTTYWFPAAEIIGVDPDEEIRRIQQRALDFLHTLK